MERSDGKNPFDPETYNRPAVSIKTMLELRAFCADFFNKHIRTSVDTDEQDIAAFLALITQSSGFFARARAVIPELQVPDVESSLSNENESVQLFLDATRGARGPSGKQWEFLPEEPAWTKLAKDGMEHLAKDLANKGLVHQKQPSDASPRGSPSKHTLTPQLPQVRMCSVIPIVLTPGRVEHKSSDSILHPPMSVKTQPKLPPKKLDLSHIPTFVPRNAMGSEELVWSPTIGTRQRRPDEIYQQSTKARPTNPTQFGRADSPNVSSAYSLKAQYLFHGSRDLSDESTKSHLRSDSVRMTPPPQFKSTQSPLNPSAPLSSRSKENSNSRRKRRNNLQETPFPDNIDGMLEMATLRHDPNIKHSSPSRFGTTAYSVNHLSPANSPSQFKGPRHPSNQASGIYGAGPFSAPPSVPVYGIPNQPSQGMYRGPPNPFQGQLDPFQSGSDVASFHPFAGQVPYVPSPEIWANQSSLPRSGALPNQAPNQIIQPIPQMIAQTQVLPSVTLAPNSETFSVPPPGSMPPLDYWNLLYQRETEICVRLRNANRPMTGQEHQYISLLAEARINAAATQMPGRGGMSKGKWLAELGRTLRTIWKTGSGGTGFPPVVVARKMDFEKAVGREIEWASQETKHVGFGGAVDRAYGS